MRDWKKGLLWTLAALALLVFLYLCLTLQSVLYALTALSGLFTTLIPLSLPFFLLQSALCWYAHTKFWRLSPLAVGGLCFLAGQCYLARSGWEALLGVCLMVLALMILLGSGLGWLFWFCTQKHHH